MYIYRRRFIVVSAIALLCSFVLLGAVLASGGPHLWPYVISAGGGEVSGGGFSIHSTMGEPVIGTSRGGPYELCAGYQCGVQTGTRLYVPMLKKSAW